MTSRLLVRHVLLLRLREELRSQFNGLETTMLVDLFDLLGPLLLNPTRWPYLTRTFNKSTVMKSVDVVRLIPLTLTEEILDLLMEALTLARRLSKFPTALTMVLGLFNGRGLEVLSLSETTIHASIIKYLEGMPSSALHSRLSTLVETILILDRTSASFSTRTSFTSASMSLAIRRFIPPNKRSPVPPLDSLEPP